MSKSSWYVTILLGFQHFLTMCIPNAIITMILIDSLCLDQHSPVKSQLISISFFVMGICTLLQTTLGCRLPIIQGATLAVTIPTITLMNIPTVKNCNISENYYLQNKFSNYSRPESVFHLKIQLINGALMISSLVEIVMATSGILGILTKLISPLSLAAIYTVLSLSIARSLLNMISEQWMIGILSLIIMLIFSTILAPKPIPIPIWSKINGWKIFKIKLFEISPVFCSILVSVLICGILTVSRVFSTTSNGWGYAARIDRKSKVISNSPIIKIPYPFQWGSPIIFPSAIVGLSTGIIVSIIESISDYMITADVLVAPKLPRYAINRGILMEGIGVFLSGLLGSAVAPTSYSDNIGLIKITKTGNNRIAQVAALIMIVCGIFPVIGSLFISIPNPVAGGVAFIICIMILACGVSNLQYVNLNSTRNSLVFGLSVAFGLFLPYWTEKNMKSISLGNSTIDEIFQILLSINLFIASLLSVVLDNILPGKYNDGMLEIPVQLNCEKIIIDTFTEFERNTFYDVKILKWLVIKCPCLHYLPLFPNYHKINKRQTNENKPVDSHACSIDNNACTIISSV